MAVIVDELSLQITGNLPKKFDGKITTIRVNRAQLSELADAVGMATALFAETIPSPPEEPKTKESSTPSGGNQEGSTP